LLFPWPASDGVNAYFDTPIFLCKPVPEDIYTRFTRAMACMRLCSRIGLSTYMVERQGASNPVSHISRTITILKGQAKCLNSHILQLIDCCLEVEYSICSDLLESIDILLKFQIGTPRERKKKKDLSNQA
jgi:hypothetical protein